MTEQLHTATAASNGGEFTGKVVLITASVLSDRLAQRFAEQGARVILAGTGTTGEVFDVRDPAQSRALVEKVVREQGRLDIWINCAEVVHLGAAETLPPEQWRASLDVILSGAFYCAQAAGQHMLTQGSGVIVNVAAADALMPMEARVAYSTAKAGLVALTEALGIEWARRGVRVVGVAPGSVRPDSTAAPESAILRRSPLHRYGTADEVAEAVLFVASDQASYIIGETLRVDGG